MVTIIAVFELQQHQKLVAAPEEQTENGRREAIVAKEIDLHVRPNRAQQNCDAVLSSHVPHFGQSLHLLSDRVLDRGEAKAADHEQKAHVGFVIGFQQLWVPDLHTQLGRCTRVHQSAQKHAALGSREAELQRQFRHNTNGIDP